MLNSLQIHAIRNLTHANLDVSAPVNTFTGPNGSGKTSILEAIFLLGRGRSFRSSQLRPVIQAGADTCTVHGILEEGRIGIQRSRDGESQFRVNGQSVSSASVLATLLPIQLINADTFQILEGGPKVRRQYLDWGVFHVEPTFLVHWKAIQQALKQRNTLLRRGRIDRLEMAVWEAVLVEKSAVIDSMRSAYVERLLPLFREFLAALSELKGIDIGYHRGWDDSKTLDVVLAESLERDLRHHTTHFGPHRADMLIEYEGVAAEQRLSRGQAKMVVSALRIAQGALLTAMTGKHCLYLIDDLPAELDRGHRTAMCRLLAESGSRVFVTAVDDESLQGCWDRNTAVNRFHVEQGNIIRI